MRSIASALALLALSQVSGFDLTGTLGPLKLAGAKFLADFVQFASEELPDVTPANGASYDFVIVGAGSAGCALAARLSEIQDATVLLIEAGGHEALPYDIPVYAFLSQFLPEVNWMYTTEPSSGYCLGMVDGRCAWPRGKVMGGTSTLNFMQAGRGFRREYEDWARMGNGGWSYEELLPYFRKLEDTQIPELRNDTSKRGTKGPLKLTYPRHRTRTTDAFLQAGQELGYKLIDYNGDPGVGFSWYQTTIFEGTRESNNRAYLHPIRGRRNLHVTMNSLVSRILLGPGARATGVQFKKGSRTYSVYARKEVILSAGTVASPQILMLSGIGPAGHLREMGIPVRKDAPVGRNLMDHVSYPALVFFLNESVGVVQADTVNPDNFVKFSLRREGILTLPEAGEAMGYVDVDSQVKEGGDPNIEFFYFSTSLTATPIFRETVRISDKISKKYFAPYDNQPAWTILPMLLYPMSRGQILLRENDINVHPKIIPNYMDDPDDVRVLIKGIRQAIEVSRTNAMRRYGSQLPNISYDECSSHEYDSDGYWECALRLLAIPMYHFAGSCKMGPESDPSAVVNPRLKVIGVDRLRVVDASVMPSHVGAHTNVPTTMIAEKAADMIKEDWGYPTERLEMKKPVKG